MNFLSVLFRLVAADARGGRFHGAADAARGIGCYISRGGEHVEMVGVDG